MKSCLQLLIAVTMVGGIGTGMASETRVVINLSEQRAYLIEQAESLWFLRLLRVNLAGKHRRVTFEFSTRI